jgi:hypothetical protein
VVFRTTGHDLCASISRFALGLQEFDGDVVESTAGVGAGDVGEVAGGVAELAVRHDDAGFRPALHGVHDVGRAERNIKVGNIVLMEKRGGVSGEAYAKDADVVIFQDEVVVGFFREGDGDRSLGGK